MEEKLNEAIKAGAEILGVDEAQFERLVFEKKQREYDREDVLAWLDEHDIHLPDEEVDTLVINYEDNYNADVSLWANIDGAYYDLVYDGIIGGERE